MYFIIARINYVFKVIQKKIIGVDGKSHVDIIPKANSVQESPTDGDGGGRHHRGKLLLALCATPGVCNFASG